jgi:hypothetical protein
MRAVAGRGETSIDVQRTHRLAVGDAADRLGEQFRHGQLADLRAGTRASFSGIVSVTTSSSSIELPMFVAPPGPTAPRTVQ